MAEKRLLLLGGTREAADLAHGLAGRRGLRVISSLAGRTPAPGRLPGELRVGGFGGALGLARYLEAAGIDLVVDATHPFARAITANAAVATRRTGRPLLRLERPPWRPEAGDRWQEVPCLEAGALLAAALGRHVLLALGRQHVPALPATPACRWLLRSIVQPQNLPPHVAWVTLPERLDAAAERAFLMAQAVDVILCRASGGEGAAGKLAAARELGVPVVMQSRPPPPDGVPLAASPAEAAAWVAAMLDQVAVASHPPVTQHA